MRRTVKWLSVVFALSAVLLGACSSDGAQEGESTASNDDRLRGDITVFAAASLTEAFTALGNEFEADHPDVNVTFNFGASSALATQLLEGAPADVFASADVANMAKLDRDAGARDAVVFAHNRAEIVVAEGNPEHVGSLQDLARGDLVVVQCAREVPCGSYTETILDKANVIIKPASFEQNVKAVVNKVALGEADAGIVYVTDVLAAGAKVDGIAIAEDVNVDAQYPIAALEASAHEAVAAAFVRFVMSVRGQSELQSFGFSTR